MVLAATETARLRMLQVPNCGRSSDWILRFLAAALVMAFHLACMDCVDSNRPADEPLGVPARCTSGGG